MTVDLFTLECECGCAAKIPAANLTGMLQRLNLPADPNLIVGPETLDDAGVYRLPGGEKLIQTVDFFPPVAREPFTYGRIAAANALSDVYAMGGRPLTAMAIVCFPASSLEPTALEEITRGALDALSEANALLVGGHSIIDPMPKFGLAVTGLADKAGLLTNSLAKPGDALVLTKPLGTGTTILAAKAGIASREQEEEANRCMGALNASAARLAIKHGAHACTDITGFGLLGHASQMARASGVALEINAGAIPMLSGAIEFAATGLLSAAAYSNRKHSEPLVAFEDKLDIAARDVLFDPQTSGGLLIALPPAQAEAFLKEARDTVPATCAGIGRVVEVKEGTEVLVRQNEPQL